MNSKKRRRAPEISAALTAKSRRAIELHQQMLSDRLASRRPFGRGRRGLRRSQVADS
jgi:hypothetical protein